MNDPYKILGVTRGADPAVIQAAYRALAKKYHPDVGGNDPVATAKFREVRAAWEVLRDQDRRAAYDRPYADAATTGKTGQPASDRPGTPQSAAEASTQDTHENHRPTGKSTGSAPSVMERLQYGAAALLVFGVGGFASALIVLCIVVIIATAAIETFTSSKQAAYPLTRETNDFLGQLAKTPPPK